MSFSREACLAFLEKSCRQTPGSVDTFLSDHFVKHATFSLEGQDRTEAEFKFYLLNFVTEFLELVDFINDGRQTAFRYYHRIKLLQEDQQYSERTLECFAACWHDVQTDKMTRLSQFGREVAPDETIWRPPPSPVGVRFPFFDSQSWKRFEILTYDVASMDSKTWLQTYFAQGATMRIDGKEIPLEIVQTLRDTVISDRRQKYLEQTMFCTDGLSHSALCYCLDQEAESTEGAFVAHEHASFTTLDPDTGKILSLNSGRRRLRPDESIYRASEQR